MKMIIKAIRRSSKAIRVLDYELHSIFGHLNFRRFIVLTRSRTGSNLLISLLESHPNIRADGEIFMELNGRDYTDSLAKVFAKQPYYIRARGFKIFYYHPRDDASCGLWNDLVNLDDLCVIHLKRRNILRTLISQKIAASQDVWLATSPSHHNGENKAVTFTVEQLKKGFRRTRKFEEDGDARFRKHPLMSVYYEDLIDDTEAVFREVSDFLGVQYLPPKTNLRRQNPESINDLLENYDQLKSAFYGTEWQPFFDE